jgi:UDP-N-acetylmuramoyl-tripeptide--D-alanyl-D-alanine ligase
MARVIGATLSPQVELAAPVTGVVIDSRLAGPGAAFVALAGQHVDGADFVADAVGRGAPLAIVGRPVAGPTALVSDPALALRQIAEVALERAREANPKLRVIAITGSVGKTTTKDLLARITRAQGTTVASEGSFNNHLGVPLTAVQADGGTDWLILEMGANHEGEIARLARIARPDVAVVLAVSNAHVGEFGSLDAVARAKTELVKGLAEGGVAVLNTSDRAVSAMRFEAPGEVMSFGLDDSARIAGYDVASDASGHLSLTLEDHYTQARARVVTRLTGEHLAIDVVGAAAAAVAAGISLAKAAAALDGAEPASPHRMAIRRLTNRLTLVDDSYNASPDSMLAAIHAVGRLARRDRRLASAVIAPMAELGEASAEAHRAAGQALALERFERVIVLGEEAREVYWGARAGGLAADAIELRPNSDGLVDAIGQLPGPGYLLLKGSHGSGLWQVAESLTAGLEADGAPGAAVNGPDGLAKSLWELDGLGDWA